MTDRTMVHFPVGDRLFNYRVAGLVISDGHVLTCREDDHAYLMLPGGRVELGESSTFALARELVEELGMPAEIVRLVYTAENFFTHFGRRIHEISAYYLVQRPVAFPLRFGDVVLERDDEGHKLRFEWLPIDETVLRDRDLKPSWIINRLRRLPAAVEHLIVEEPS